MFPARCSKVWGWEAAPRTLLSSMNSDALLGPPADLISLWGAQHNEVALAQAKAPINISLV